MASKHRLLCKQETTLNEHIYFMYSVSKKNDTDVTHYNFNSHQLILVIFGGDVAQSISTIEW